MIFSESFWKNKVSRKKAGGGFLWPDNCPLWGQIWPGRTTFKPAEVFFYRKCAITLTIFGTLQPLRSLSNKTLLPVLKTQRGRQGGTDRERERVSLWSFTVFLHLYPCVHIKSCCNYEAHLWSSEKGRVTGWELNEKATDVTSHFLSALITHITSRILLTRCIITFEDFLRLFFLLTFH